MKTLDILDLAHVIGGTRTSSGSSSEVVAMLKQTKDALSDLSRAKTSTDSSSMMPMMMMMMMKRH